MKKRFIGPANPGPDGEDLGHEINVRGRYVGKARAGEVIDVPDELCQDVRDPKTKAVVDAAPVWPAELWEDAADEPDQVRPAEAPAADESAVAVPAPAKKKGDEK